MVNLLETRMLEMAMVAARDLPPDMQGEITRLVLALASDEPLPAILSTGSDAAGSAEAARPIPTDAPR